VPHTETDGRFQELAARYFDRRSFTMPVFIGTDQLACLDDASGTTQISVVSLANGEITPVTDYPDRLQSLLGSTASGRILFGKDRDGNERQQLWTIDAVGEEPRRLTHADASIHEPGPLTADGSAVLYRTNARDETTFDIASVALDGGEPETWLENGGQVTPVAVDKEGERALVIRTNGNLDADLLLVHRDGHAAVLTPHTGEQWIFDAAFTPDGAGVWLLSNLDREFVALVHIDLESRERTTVYEAGWDVELFKPSPDGQKIALSVNENGASRPRIISANGGAGETPITVPLGVIDRFSWSPDSSEVAFGFSSAEHPSAIIIARLDGKSRVVAADTGTAPETVAPEAITYETWDGRQIPGFFFKPKGAGPFPAVLEIHGGPEGQRQLNYNGRSGPAIQLLASLGIAVLALNVRGSTGYGKTYSHLDDKSLRLDAVQDLVSAAEWLRGRDDIIADKIAVFGASYGGFMTLAALAFHSEHWAAGVELVGIADFVTFLERTGPWRRSHREAEYGSLAEDREMLARISPIHAVDRIAAPLLIFHGREDPRVPLYESEQIAEAVRSRGLDVDLHIFDDEGHAISKRKNVIDAFSRTGEFLTRHLCQ
jgi:dipeptidyl aminopeptidase/acylaminoacyl peptidase